MNRVWSLWTADSKENNTKYDTLVSSYLPNLVVYANLGMLYY